MTSPSLPPRRRSRVNSRGLEHLTPSHWAMLDEYIDSRANLSLAAIDRVIAKNDEQLCDYRDRLCRWQSAEEIELCVINECKRKQVEKRSRLEQTIVDEQHSSENLQNRINDMANISTYLQSRIDLFQSRQEEWEHVRQRFIERKHNNTLSPITSPITSPPESPRLEKGNSSKTMPQLEKAKSTTSLMASPRRALTTSARSVKKHMVAAFATVAQPLSPRSSYQEHCADHE